MSGYKINKKFPVKRGTSQQKEENAEQLIPGIYHDITPDGRPITRVVLMQKIRGGGA